MDMTLEGIIGWDVMPADIRSQLKNAGSRKVTLHINSPGGNVYDGIAINNMLKAHEPGVDVIVDGLAASAASVVMAAGSSVAIAPGAAVMIHDPWMATIGNSADHSKAIDMLAIAKASIVQAYQSRPLTDVDSLSAQMAEETWFDAAGAVAAGFADKVLDGVKAAPYSVPQGMFRHTPEAFVVDDAERLAQAQMAAARVKDGEYRARLLEIARRQ